MSRRRKRLVWSVRRIRPWWRRFRRNGYRIDHCEHCGHRFRFRRDARHSFGNEDSRVYHSPCMSYVVWRRKAEERLTVLGVVVDLTNVTADDLRQVMSFRAAGGPADEGDQWNLAWRVFYDLEQQQGVKS
jgi:hypothetical protein